MVVVVCVCVGVCVCGGKGERESRGPPAIPPPPACDIVCARRAPCVCGHPRRGRRFARVDYMWIVGGTRRRVRVVKNAVRRVARAAVCVARLGAVGARRARVRIDCGDWVDGRVAVAAAAVVAVVVAVLAWGDGAVVVKGGGGGGGWGGRCGWRMGGGGGGGGGGGRARWDGVRVEFVGGAA